MRRWPILFLVLVIAVAMGPVAAQAKGAAVVVGISQYRDKHISPLIGADNDAVNLAKTLEEAFDLPSEHVFVLTSGSKNTENEPTTGRIVKKLEYIAANIRPDFFVFAFSGHGFSRDDQNYLLTYLTEMNDLESSALDLARVKRLVDQIQASKKLIIIDACRDNPILGKGGGGNLLTERFAKGIAPRPRDSAEPQFVATLFSCSLGQRSFEYPGKGRGFFSYFLEQGLRGRAANPDGEVTLAGLVGYLQKEVPNKLKQELDAEQTPYMIMEGRDPAQWVLCRAMIQPPGGLRIALGGPELLVVAAGLGVVVISFWVVLRRKFRRRVMKNMPPSSADKAESRLEPAPQEEPRPIEKPKPPPYL